MRTLSDKADETSVVTQSLISRPCAACALSQVKTPGEFGSNATAAMIAEVSR